MPLDSDIKNFLDNSSLKRHPPYSSFEPKKLREFFNEAYYKKEKPKKIQVRMIEQIVFIENREIRCRIYYPESPGPFSALMYFHGGGFVIRDEMELYDQTCRMICKYVNCAVVAVDFRLAPEDPFPAAAEDCYAVTTWVSKNAYNLNIIPEKLGVYGESCGGNLATVVAMMARDRKGPSLCCQVIVTAMLDMNFSRRSYQVNGKGEYFLTEDSMKWFWSNYLSKITDARNPYCLPLKSTNLKGLPAAFVATVEFDPLRDEGKDYADKLKESAVNTEYKCYDGLIHGFFDLYYLSKKARDACQDILNKTKTLLCSNTHDHSQVVKQLLFGYYDTQCLFAVSKSGVLEYLSTQPKNIMLLSKQAGVNAESLYRIMRYLAAKGLFDELSGKNFKLNQASNYFIKCNQNRLKNFICLHGQYFYQAAKNIGKNLTSGKMPFELSFGFPAGKLFEGQSDASTIYHEAMLENSEILGKYIVEAYNFSSYKVIVDIGGGLGSLLANILLTYKDVQGINFDRPNLKEAAEKNFRALGLSGRYQFIGGDAFESIPSGGDLYILKAMLHGMSNQQVVSILKNCEAVLRSNNGKLLAIERVIQKDNHYIEACINDINMLNVTKGKVRTRCEFEEIFKQAGLFVENVYYVSEAINILELVLIK